MSPVASRNVELAELTFSSNADLTNLTLVLPELIEYIGDDDVAEMPFELESLVLHVQADDAGLSEELVETLFLSSSGSLISLELCDAVNGPGDARRFRPVAAHFAYVADGLQHLYLPFEPTRPRLRQLRLCTSLTSLTLPLLKIREALLYLPVSPPRPPHTLHRRSRLRWLWTVGRPTTSSGLRSCSSGSAGSLHGQTGAPRGEQHWRQRRSRAGSSTPSFTQSASKEASSS